LIKAPEGDTAYAPDGVVIDRTALAREPLWQKSSTLIHGTSIPLVIEITSNNWRDDYWHKLSDYETLGIAEYWIVDYQALGGRRYIGEPKVPTISVFQLVNEEYQAQLFRGNDRIRSKVFPELNLTAEQIFRAGA
jgi:Uma2 family endonuclease